MATISKRQMADLLGRPLSDYEDKNFDNLESSAVSQLEHLLGNRIAANESTMVYQPRPGYKTLPVDPLTQLLGVKIGGKDVDAMTSLRDDFNASWFDTLVFDKPMNDEFVEVKAKFGFDEPLPLDLSQLIATLFGMISQPVDTANNGAISSESILNHSVSYTQASPDAVRRFVDANQQVLAYYGRPATCSVYGSEVCRAFSR